jgi:hypothetical protein
MDDIAHPLRRPRARDFHRGALALLGLVSVAIAGAAVAGLAAGAGLTDDPGANVRALAILATPVLLPLMLTAPRLLPAGARAPSRAVHLPLAILVVGALALGGPWLVWFQAARLGLEGAIVIPDALRTAMPVALLLALLTTIFSVRAGPPDPGTAPMQDEALLTGGRGAPRRPKKPKHRPRGRLSRLVGGLVGGYDWLAMRVLGAGMIGTAWLIWQMMAAPGTPPLLTALSFGQPPLHALAAWLAAGVLLAVPLLLPGWLVTPRNVLAGGVKAAMLLGAAWLLAPMLPVAIDLLAPPALAPELLRVGPAVFARLAWIAAALAMAAAFYRHLQPRTRVDYLGRPVLELTKEELYDMRRSRMG